MKQTTLVNQHQRRHPTKPHKKVAVRQHQRAFYPTRSHRGPPAAPPMKPKSLDRKDLQEWNDQLEKWREERDAWEAEVKAVGPPLEPWELDEDRYTNLSNRLNSLWGKYDIKDHFSSFNDGFKMGRANAGDGFGQPGGVPDVADIYKQVEHDAEWLEGKRPTVGGGFYEKQPPTDNRSGAFHAGYAKGQLEYLKGRQPHFTLNGIQQPHTLYFRGTAVPLAEVLDKTHPGWHTKGLSHDLDEDITKVIHVSFKNGDSKEIRAHDLFKQYDQITNSQGGST